MDWFALQSHKAPAYASYVGKADDAERIKVVIVVRRRVGHAPITDCPVMPQRRLSNDEFAARWGAAQEDFDAITAFYRDHRLTVVEQHAGRRQITLEGTIGDVNAVFGIELGHYLKLHAGRTHIFRSHASYAHVPAHLSDHILGVFGLDNEPILSPHYKIAVTPSLESPPGTTSLTPNEVIAFYDWPTTATGQTIGIFVGGVGSSGDNLGYNTSDVISTCASFSVPTPSIVNVSVDGTIGNVAPSVEDDLEPLLDITMCASFAQGATLAAYFGGSFSLAMAIGRMVHPTLGDPVCQVITISYGADNELDAGSASDPSTDQAIAAGYFTDAANLGVTVCCSSGDHGSSGNIVDGFAHCDWPANHPYVLAIGGTVIGDSTEWLWNQKSVNDGGGGGVSEVWARPSYQTGVGVPLSDTNGIAGRGQPDLSGNASPNSGYVLDASWLGGNTQVGGTSASSPMYAGAIASMNYELESSLGLINPTLYAAGNAVVRDLNPTNTAGGPHDNSCNSAPGYNLVNGWDPCVGWGVLDLTAFVALFIITALTGASAQGGVGTFAIAEAALATGVFAQGEGGTPIAGESEPALVIGVSAQGEVGTPDTGETYAAPIAGAFAHGGVGTTVTDQSVTISGALAKGHTGTFTFMGTDKFGPVSGASAHGGIGTFTVVYTVPISGTFAQGAVASLALVTTYLDPLGKANPFLTTPPVVLVVRHVRITGIGEVVIEDANTLPRYLMRVDAHRVFPRPQVDAPAARNLPEHGQRKKAF